MSLVIGAALLSGLAFWSLHRPLAAQPLDAVPQVATEVTPVETSASQQAEQSGNPTSDVSDKKEHRSASSPRCRWHPAARFLAACRPATDTGPARQSVPPPATAAVAMPDDDVTKVGILTNANFRGDKASILGLRVGQTWDEARKAVQANPELMIREDRMSRFYVYDRRGSEAGGAVFYCQWPDGTAGMGRLVIYAGIARFLSAGDARLFVARSAASLPPDVKSWLGAEDRAVVSLNVRSVKITNHVYQKRALEVSDVRAIFAAPHVMVIFARPDLLAPHK